MQQLSPLDALFLSVETNETPSHIGGLAVLDPNTGSAERFRFEAFRKLISARLSACPRFTWTVREVPLGLDQPYWVGEANLDLDQHIHRVRVRAPGGTQELARLAGKLFQGRLDRTKPLWEMYFIEGLQGGRAALLWKVHHSLLDGLSGAGLVEQLFDHTACPETPRRPVVPEAARAGAPPSPVTWGSRALQNATRRPAAMWRHGTTSLTRWLEEDGQTGRSPRRAAPRTPINGVVGSARSVAWTHVSFERVRTLKRVLGVTVNDVVLGLTSESVRRYLRARSALPEASMVVSVPVSLRAAGDQTLGNQIVDMSVDWGTSIEDPVERVRSIHVAATRAKHVARAGEASWLHLMAETLAPGALSQVVRLGCRLADRVPLATNAVISNVPFSPTAIFVAGAKVERIIPMSILPPTQGCNITVLTYCGEMHFGITTDPGLVDNEWELADGIPKALNYFERAAQGSLAAGRSRSKSSRGEDRELTLCSAP